MVLCAGSHVQTPQKIGRTQIDCRVSAPRAAGYRQGVPITVSALTRYPVKSCRGQSVDEITVEPWGPAGDRRWMIVDDRREVITAREVHQLLLVEPHPVDG